MKRLIIPVFTAAMLLSGCSKFLEERSQSEIIPTTVEDFSDLLVSEGYPSTTPYLYPQLMFMSDDMEFYASSDLRDNSALRVNYPAFQWQPDLIDACRLAGSNDTQKFNTWKIYYEMLQRVNWCCNTSTMQRNAVRTRIRKRLCFDAPGLLLLRPYQYIRTAL